MKKILPLLMLCMFFLNFAKAQTEIEPNNVWNQSNLITIGATGTGTTVSGGDEDWWRVVTPGDGKLTVNWTSTNGLIVYCQVYDTVGNILLANNYTNGTIAHNIDGLAKGTYYIKFSAYYTSEAPAYSFTPTFTAAAVANNIEPDSTVALAKTLPLNGSATGHINYYYNNHRDSTDWYKVNVVQDGSLSFTITSENGQNVYAQLFDGDGTSYFVGNYTTATATYLQDGLAPGIYYIRIRTYYSSEFAPYTLSNTFTPPPSANDPIANETPATASTLPLNGSVTGHIGFHYNGSRDDVDWWKVTVDADGRLDFTITSNNAQDVYAQLFDGDGTTYLVGSYTTNSATYSKDGLAPGVYYIKIQTYYLYEFTSYSLSNTLTQPSQANDLGSNDVFTGALPFPVNTTKTGHIGYRYNGNIDATDWYKIVVTGDGKIDFTITSENGQNVYAQLFDGDGTTYFVGNYTTGTANYSKDGLAAGTYYLRIQTYFTTEFAPYTLSNTVTVVPTPNDIEPNNTVATAGTLAVNSTIEGHTGYHYNGNRDDADYYALTLPVDGKLTFGISNLNGQNVYAQLYDHDGTTYLAGNYTTTSNSYTVYNLAAGTYYILIHTYYTSEFSPYTLTNSFEPMNFTAETAGDNSIAAKGTLLAANTATGGHLNFYYNLAYDNIDWWKIGYDGVGGTMALHIDEEQNHANTDYPYIDYALYLDTLAAPVASGQLHAATNTINLSSLSVGIYYLRMTPAYNTFGAYQLNATYTERCANVVAINSSTQLAGCNGNITYGISGGLAPYTVQLYKNTVASGAPQVVDNTNTITFTNLGVGTYYARSYSFGASGSCNNISGNTVFAIPATPTISAGGATTFCQGGTVTLTSTAAASYLWSTGATTQSITVNASGNYAVTAYNAAGCASLVSATTVVTVNPLPATPVISAGSATTFCAGGSVTLTASSATSYLWSTGATTQSITVNAGGNYSVTVKNSNGCSSASSAATTVTVNPLPATPTITAGAATTFCAGGTVTLTSSAATGNLWSTGATTQSISVNATGNYSVTVTNGNGCSATSSATAVTVNPLPATPTIAAGTATTFCTGGTVTLTSSVATGNLWSTGATTQSINVNASGNYIVTVTNGNGCSATSAATVVTVNPLPTVTLAAFTAVCSNDAAFGLSGGSPAGGTYTGTGVSGGQFSPATAGVGTFTINYSYTNTNGCTATATNTITVNNCTAPCTSSITPGGPTTFCQGATVVLTASAGVSWLWSNGATTQSITVNSSGTYSVAVTDANNCVATAPGVTVTVNPLPATPTIAAGSATIFCAGGSVPLTSSAATGNLWSTGATTQSININASGNYSVTVTNGNGCSATSAATTVTVNPLPATPTIAAGSATTFCTGGSVALTSSSATGNLWSTGATTQSINVTANGSYNVTVTNGNGCSATSAATMVTVNPLPAVTLAAFTAVCSTDQAFTLSGGSPAGGSYSGTGVSGGQFNPATAGVGTFTITYSYTNANACTATATNSITVNNCGGCTASISTDKSTTFCQGGNVTLTANAGASYLWSTGATTQSITVNAGGSYTVTVTNANNCAATSAATIITVNPLPGTPTITAGSATTFCAGGSVTLTSSAAASYAWSTGATTQAITVNAGGNYSVTVKNTAGCSASSAATTVTVNPLPTVTLAAFTAVCNNAAAFTLAGGSPSGGTYSGTGVSGTQFNPATAGVGTFSITYSYTNANGCTSAASQSITVTNCAGCTATITPDKSTTFCKGGSVKLTASSGTSYSWNTGETTQSIIVTSGGTYTVSVNNANNCTATASITVVVSDLPAIPVISASGPVIFCQGGSVILTSAAASSYTWSNGATTQSITVTSSGNYTVEVKNEGGCSRTSAATTVLVNNCGAVYCAANGNSRAKGYIANVYLKTIFNNSGWSAGGYGNYLNQSATLNKRGSYIISVSPGFTSYFNISGLYTRVWIDWNQDGDFNDPGEVVFSPGGASYFLRVGIVHVPANALSGRTRMRVAVSAQGFPSNCGSFAYGEVEDYSIVVAGSTTGKNTEVETTEPVIANESFKLYPNPVSEELVIQRSISDQSKVVDASAAMVMLDANGRIVLSAKLTRSTEVIDVRRYPSGIYFIQLKTKISITTQKIIISH